MILKLKYLITCISIRSLVILASNAQENDEIQEENTDAFDEFKNFTLLSEISTFLNQSEVKDMRCLSKAFTKARVPDNLTELSFLSKNEALPEYFAHGPVDYEFFNRFSPADLQDEKFLMTIVNVCHTGLNLNCCGPSARHAATKLIALMVKNPESPLRKMLMANLNKIIALLIKTGSFDLIGRLLMIEDVRMVTPIFHMIDGLEDNQNILLNVVLSIEDVPGRKRFINTIAFDEIWCIYGIKLAMDLYPEMLVNIVVEGQLSHVMLRSIILHYSENLDAEAHNLIYIFKTNLLEEPGSVNYNVHFANINSYLHGETTLFTEDESVTLNEIYTFCIAAFAKRDRALLIQLLSNRQIYEPYIGSPILRSQIAEKILNDPVFFRTLLPALHQTPISTFFLERTIDLFGQGLPQDEKLQAILQVIMEFYSENPGLHFNIIIFPEILNKDLDSFINYLKENTHFIDSYLSNIINTVLLIEQRPKKIIGFLDNLGQNFPSVLLSFGFWVTILKKASFQTISKLLQRPEYAKKIRKVSAGEMNWEISNIRRIFQNDLIFKIFYPIRQIIWNANFKSFDLKTLPTTFVTVAELKSFLTFFDFFYVMPETRNQDKSFDGLIQTDYNLLVNFCENDINLGLQVMNYTLLVPYIQKHRSDVEMILKTWFYNHTFNLKLKRIVELVRDSDEFVQKPIIIEIGSLGMFKLNAFYLLHYNNYRGIKLKFNIEAILSEFSRLPESRVYEIMRYIGSCRFLYDQTVGPFKSVIDQLQELKRKN